MAGTLVSATVLVELLGFRHTLWVAAAGNFSVAIVAGLLAFNRGQLPSRNATAVSRIVQPVLGKDRLDRFALALLFLTGFAALGMEVMWARAFTPVLKTQVYSFALVVFAYLGATFVGSFDLSVGFGEKFSPFSRCLALDCLCGGICSDRIQ